MYSDEPAVLDYGQLKQSGYFTKPRNEDEPFVSYEISLGEKMVVTKAALVGERLFDIIPVIIARTGGLYNPLRGLSLLLVGLFTKSSFIAHVLQNLFLVRKYDPEMNEESSRVSF